jgi:hypothetical protein
MRHNDDTSSLGWTVPIEKESTHKIRVFPLLSSVVSQPRLRSNATHDSIVNLDDRNKPKDKDSLCDIMRGHVGPCVLRSLKFFDVGSSFLSDTLHNLYHGVTVSS